VINNYIRFMNAVHVDHIVCFDSYSSEDIDQVQLELRQHSKLKAVIWNRVKPFEHLPEVGEMGRPANAP
jgi:hypothetical protein